MRLTCSVLSDCQTDVRSRSARNAGVSPGIAWLGSFDAQRAVGCLGPATISDRKPPLVVKPVYLVLLEPAKHVLACSECKLEIAQKETFPTVFMRARDLSTHEALCIRDMAHTQGISPFHAAAHHDCRAGEYECSTAHSKTHLRLLLSLNENFVCRVDGRRWSFVKKRSKRDIFFDNLQLKTRADRSYDIFEACRSSARQVCAVAGSSRRQLA